MDLESKYYLCSTAVLWKMHWINNSVCICLTMLSLQILICIPLRYCIRICVLKAPPHPLLLLRSMLSSLLTTGWYPVALPVCITCELRPHHMCLWQSVLILWENESGSSRSKFPLFLLNWPNVRVCVLGDSYITSNLHAFGFSLQFILKFISHKFICLPSCCFPGRLRISTL